MTKKKRYSPLVMLFDAGKLIKNSFFFILFLFVIKADSTSLFITYGRIIFLIAVSMTIWSIIYKWLTHKYVLNENSFHLHRGLFSKSEKTIPFTKIQNVNQHTSWFYRLFNLTSIRFETGMTGTDATITFDVISQKEAVRIRANVKDAERDNTIQSINDYDDLLLNVDSQTDDQMIHFKPTKKDIIKASFSSLSFFVLIPIIVSFYYKLNEIFRIERVTDGFFQKLVGTWWIVTLIVLFLLLASIAFGLIKTFFKYGKYEISSDEKYIYIAKGIVDEIAFSISKDKVQAIVIEQTFMKRVLGMAEVRLTTAGSLSLNDETLAVNTLYPFMPVHQAYALVSELLPSYTITENMNRLPKKSFWARIAQPNWLWLIATGVLIYFKPTILNRENLWILLPVILLVCIFLTRLLDYLHTKFVLNDQFLQIKKGVLTTILFVSKREKIIEVKVTQNLIQKMFHLASIGIVNRGKPIHHTNLDDIPIAEAATFMNWYKDRQLEVSLVKS